MTFEQFTSIPNRSFRRLSKPLLILVFTLAGFVVMGYHPGLEDDGIYLSAVKFDLNPALYPHDSEFFRLQTQATVFDRFLSGFVRLTRVPVAWAELLWQFLSLYIILLAAHGIAQKLFPEPGAQWAAVALLAAMFTLPVAGTALNLADQHLHPRNMATALMLVAIDRMLAGRRWQTFVLLLLAAVMHPIMAAFGISFCFFLGLVLTNSIYARIAALPPRRLHAGLAAALPLGWIFEPPTPEWRRALNTRTYYFLYQWRWYEWLGAIGPLVLFWLLWRWTSEESRPGCGEAAASSVSEPGSTGWGDTQSTGRLVTGHDFSRAVTAAASGRALAPEASSPGRFAPVSIFFRSLFSRAGKFSKSKWALTPASRIDSNSLIHQSGDRAAVSLLARFAMALLLYGAFQQAVAMILLAPPSLVRVTPLQPMRYLHLEYIFLVLIVGGMLGRHILRRSAWRWALFLTVANGGMFLSQKLLLPATEHLELPGRASGNAWVRAFTWIRGNTPTDAWFALDPGYLAVPGQDYHSFRALAERSQLADSIKDAAVVTQVPRLAPRWVTEVDAQAGWNRFQISDFERLRDRFGIDWVLLSNPPPPRLTCIWHYEKLSVCRIPALPPAPPQQSTRK